MREFIDDVTEITPKCKKCETPLVLMKNKTTSLNLMFHLIDGIHSFKDYLTELRTGKEVRNKKRIIELYKEWICPKCHRHIRVY